MRPRPLCRAFAVCLAKMHFPCGLEHLRQMHCDSRLDSQKCELLQIMQQPLVGLNGFRCRIRETK